jgi:uncharacterized membrane protein YbhN (UPF0104 family)
MKLVILMAMTMKFIELCNSAIQLSIEQFLTQQLFFSFDITFFFFIIVILLAIIQGLIIDAFGELRDQLESVKEDMESNCFICGIGKDYFDKVPHGFDTHVAQV